MLCLSSYFTDRQKNAFSRASCRCTCPVVHLQLVPVLWAWVVFLKGAHVGGLPAASSVSALPESELVVERSRSGGWSLETTDVRMR